MLNLTMLEQSSEDVNTGILNPVSKLDQFHSVSVGQQIEINGVLYELRIPYAKKNANVDEIKSAVSRKCSSILLDQGKEEHKDTTTNEEQYLIQFKLPQCLIDILPDDIKKLCKLEGGVIYTNNDNILGSLYKAFKDNEGIMNILTTNSEELIFEGYLVLYESFKKISIEEFNELFEHEIRNLLSEDHNRDKYKQICSAAVKQDGRALEFVQEGYITKEMCLIAIEHLFK